MLSCSNPSRMYFRMTCEEGMCLSPSSLPSRAWGKAYIFEVCRERDPRASRVREKNMCNKEQEANTWWCIANLVCASWPWGDAASSLATWCVYEQFSSVAQSWPTLCNSMDCSTPRLPVCHQLPELHQTHVHWINNATQPSYLPSLLLLPSIFPSIRVFPRESVLPIRWPKQAL